MYNQNWCFPCNQHVEVWVISVMQSRFYFLMIILLSIMVWWIWGQIKGPTQACRWLTKCSAWQRHFQNMRPHRRPPGSPVPGILKARTLEWVAIAFSNARKWKVKVKSLSHIRPSATPWTAAYQAPPSMGFSRQEYWSGMPLPSLNSCPQCVEFSQIGD